MVCYKAQKLSGHYSGCTCMSLLFLQLWTVSVAFRSCHSLSYHIISYHIISLPGNDWLLNSTALLSIYINQNNLPKVRWLLFERTIIHGPKVYVIQHCSLTKWHGKIFGHSTTLHARCHGVKQNYCKTVINVQQTIFNRLSFGTNENDNHWATGCLSRLANATKWSRGRGNGRS